MKPTPSLRSCIADARKRLMPPKKSLKPVKPSKPTKTKDADQLSGGDGGSISFNG